MNKAIFDIGGNGVQYKINSDEINLFSTINKDKKYVLDMIGSIINENKITHVGISSPCGVDDKTGELYGISGIKDYENFNLYNELKSRCHNDVYIVAHNDANAALLGNLINEYYKSASQVTIGTGIGGAVMINNEIITGVKGMAGEFGYAPFSDNLNTSQQCSANALVRIINAHTNNNFLNYKDVVDSKIDVTEPMLVWSNNVSKLILNIFFSLSPEVIFLSGGITSLDSIQKAITNAVSNKLKLFNYIFSINIKYKNIKNPGILGMDYLVNNQL